MISWRKNYTHLNSWATRNTCSVVLRQNSSGMVFTVTNVYGPSENAFKPNFVVEIGKAAELVNSKWFLIGDFNMVGWWIDRE